MVFISWIINAPLLSCISGSSCIGCCNFVHYQRMKNNLVNDPSDTPFFNKYQNVQSKVNYPIFETQEERLTSEIINDLVNDENLLNDSDLSDSYDPLEELLLLTPSTSSYSIHANDQFLDFDNPLNQPLPPSDPLWTTSSYLPPHSTEPLLEESSTISNILYNNKMKEQLRKKRNSSTDLTSNLKNRYSGSLHSHSNSSLNLNKPQRITKPVSPESKRSNQTINRFRSQSVSAVPLLTPLPSFNSTSSSFSSTSSPSLKIQKDRVGSISPNTKATNPFYHPPAILKRLSNSE